MLSLAPLVRTAKVLKEMKPLPTENTASVKKRQGTCSLVLTTNSKWMYEMYLCHQALDVQLKGWGAIRKKEVKIARPEPSDSQVMFM